MRPKRVMKHFKFVGIILALALGVLLLRAVYSKNDPGLIFSYSKAKISAVEFYVLYAQPPRSVHLNNTQTLNYFGRLLSAPTEGSVSGYAHRIRLKLISGQEYDLPCVIAYDGKTFAIGIEQGVFTDDKFYSFHITENSPEELRAAVQVLIKSQEK